MSRRPNVLVAAFKTDPGWQIFSTLSSGGPTVDLTRVIAVEANDQGTSVRLEGSKLPFMVKGALPEQVIGRLRVAVEEFSRLIDDEDD
jgi:hypothetical protein